MKRNLHAQLIALFCCLAFCLNAQEWEQLYPTETVAGFPGQSLAFDVKTTVDGGFIMVGEAHAASGAIRDYIRLVKTDAEGTMEWSKIYNEGQIIGEYAASIALTSDGGYLIGGSTLFGYKMHLVKTAANGDTIWTRANYGDFINTIQTGRSVIESSVGDYIFVGTTHFDEGTGHTAFFVVKTDSDGNELWSKNFLIDGNGDDGATDVIQTSDGHFVVCGNYLGQAVLLKVDTDGNLLWTKMYVNSKADGAYSLVESANSELVLGSSMSGFAGVNAAVLITDANGVQLSSNFLAGWGHAQDIAGSTDGGFGVVGFSDAISSGQINNLMIKVDAGGQALWSRQLSENYIASGYAIQAVGADCFVVAGRAEGGMYLTKICMDSNPVDEFEINNQWASIYPNPASNTFVVEANQPLEGLLNFKIYNVLGQQILQQKLSATRTLFNTSFLAKGTYIYQISNDKERLQTGRLLIR